MVTDGSCIQRAVSTMRLALGYETALPEGWEPGEKNTIELMAVLSDCFPGREILVICPTRQFKATSHLVHHIDSADMRDIDEDQYMVAFTYLTHRGRGHMLVGIPKGQFLFDRVVSTIGVSLTSE